MYGYCAALHDQPPQLPCGLPPHLCLKCHRWQTVLKFGYRVVLNFLSKLLKFEKILYIRIIQQIMLHHEMDEISTKGKSQ